MTSFRILMTILAFIAVTAVAGSSIAADAVAPETSTAPAVTATQAPASEPPTAESVNPIARRGRTGLGLSVSTYSPGLTTKCYLSHYFAAQLLVGTTVQFGGLSLGLDGVFDLPFLIQNKHLVLKRTLGVGVNRSSFTVDDESFKATYVTGVSGAGIQFKRVPIELVLEGRLGMMSIGKEMTRPVSQIAYDFGFTTRYFF